MKHEPVQSSHISHIGYDESTQDLHVTFKSGEVYVYQDVPPDKYQALMMSSSKGQFLHYNIKGQHSHGQETG